MKHSTAYFLADIVEAGLTDEQTISENCWNLLKEVFGDVPVMDRADVYIRLLDILHARGVELDMPDIAQGVSVNNLELN